MNRSTLTGRAMLASLPANFWFRDIGTQFAVYEPGVNSPLFCLPYIDAAPKRGADVAQFIVDACNAARNARGGDARRAPIEWKERELNYCAALVRTGGDSPRVPSAAVDSYLEVQHASARRAGEPDVAECVVMLQMIRAQSDEAVRAAIWRAFWSKADPYRAVS